ncbi:MAG TPA: COX15/CtaA family protein [Pyrinomonadaceae bacterium]|nr:COX15/CtaA family protein [Pyrinomonadaceae bacterium]
MNEQTKLSGFVKYTWFVLAYNVLVILWGVFLRASKSGDGCGQHWLTCHGEVVPSAPELKTVIEFSHRLMSAADGIIVIILVIWAFRKFAKGHILRKLALASLALVIVEGLIGAGLVLTGNTAGSYSASRPFWAMGHLISTFILLTAMTLTAWFASGNKILSLKVSRKVFLLLGIGVFGILLVGMSGSLAALSNMLFPSQSLSEGIAKDFSASSHYLLRLRLSHPIVSILTSVYLIFLAGWLRKKSEKNPSVVRWSNILSVLILVQIAFGAATLLMLAPIVMQLGHLLLADLIWISFVLLTANFLQKDFLAADEHG